MANHARPRVGVVGAGRVGAVLAATLSTTHPVTAVSGRSDASRTRIETLLPGVPVRAPSEVAESCDILVLAVPDDRLAEVARDLAGAGHIRAGQVVAHTSGRHGTDVLAPVSEIGARPVAMHPAMTFTGTDVDLDRLDGCVFGLTAADADRAVAEGLVADLGGRPMWIPEGRRTAYHAALAHGANHLVTLVSQAMGLLRQAGAEDPSEVLRPLLGAALDNVLAYGDAALTGPVARGDVSTVEAHLQALADGPAATMDSYLELARATVRGVADDGRLDPDRVRRIRRVLEEAEWDSLAAIQADVPSGA